MGIPPSQLPATYPFFLKDKDMTGHNNDNENASPEAVRIDGDKKQPLKQAMPRYIWAVVAATVLLFLITLFMAGQFKAYDANLKAGLFASKAQASIDQEIEKIQYLASFFSSQQKDVEATSLAAGYGAIPMAGSEPSSTADMRGFWRQAIYDMPLNEGAAIYVGVKPRASMDFELWASRIGNAATHQATSFNAGSLRQMMAASNSVFDGHVFFVSSVPGAMASDYKSEIWQQYANKNFVSKPFALASLVSFDDGSQGFLMGVYAFENIFEDALNDNVSTHVKVSDSNKTIVFEFKPTHSFSSLMGSLVAVEKDVTVGQETLQLTQYVAPSGFSTMMGLLPWLVLVGGMGGAIVLVFKQPRFEAQTSSTDLTLYEKTSKANTDLLNQLARMEKDYAAIAKKEKDHRNIIDSISDIIFEVDEKGYLVYVNQTWERLTDIEPWTAIDTPLLDLFIESDYDALHALFQDYVSGERQHARMQTKLRRMDGGYTDVELSFSMIRINDEKQVRVVGAITDIRERKKQQKALEEAELQYKSMVEKSLGGLYRSSAAGRFISANPAMANILGYDSPEDLMQSIKNIRNDFYVDNEIRTELLQQINDEDGSTDLEAQVYKKDGTIIWVSETCRPVKDDKGNLKYYEGTLTDISRRKETEHALVRAKAHSDMANRAKSEFLANMSHELRTPLNAIIGFSEILKNELFGPLGKEEYKEYSGDIYESGTHLLRIINDILDVSKIEAGKRELHEDMIDLYAISEAAFKMVKPKADLEKISMENKVPVDFPKLRAEELAVKQILINLLNNSVKFTDEKGKVTAHASIDEQGDAVISISDNGIGMKADDIDKALSPFGQLDADLDRKESGTGLGLTLVKQLTELHGGMVEIQSQPGEGTTVFIRFPAARVIDA